MRFTQPRDAASAGVFVCLARIAVKRRWLPDCRLPSVARRGYAASLGIGDDWEHGAA